MKNYALLGALVRARVNAVECLLMGRLKFQILISRDAANLAIQLQLGRRFKRAREEFHLRFV